MPHSTKSEGFTLLEILIVVTIIGALMALLANQFLGRQQEASVKIAGMQIKKLEQALEMYRMDNGRYPTSEQGLVALVREPVLDPAPRRYAAGAYVKSADLEDPWQQEFYYERPGEHNRHSFDLFSYGPDGLQGGEGLDTDIVNWDTGVEY